MGMTNLIARQLWLLGPARINQNQNTRSRTTEIEAKGSFASEVPRFRSRRTIALLGYIVSEQRPVSRDLLAAFLWPDEAPSKGRANLRRELHILVKILPGCWKMDRQAVAFTPSADTTVDLYQLQELEAQERWEDAAELVGGEFLEGLSLGGNLEYENWLQVERERWRDRAEVILTTVIDSQIQRGRYTDALQHTQRLLQLAPWNEEAHRQAMRLLAWTGRRGDALRQFKSCKRVLSEELDIEPAFETIALYQQIRSGEISIPPQLPAFITEEKARREFEQPIFVGREDELRRFHTFLAEALAGEGRVVLVTGEPGRGKTALLQAFAQRALQAYPDLLVASGKCTAYSSLGDPYLPFRDVMRMLTGDVEAKWDAGSISRDHARRLWFAFPLVVQVLLDYGPQLLDVLIPTPLLLSRAIAAGEDYAPWLPRLMEQIKHNRTSTENLMQSHLFQQVSDVLHYVTQEQPLLLILDDIQWSDTASISLLFHLGRRIADGGYRLLIACAYRPEEVAMGQRGKRHPLEKPLKEFKRVFGEVWVDLDQVEAAEGRSFVDALLDVEVNRLSENFREALFHRTEGHPLFTIELLRSLQERGNLMKDTDGIWIESPTLDWEVLPVRVEAVIEERIGQIGPDLQELLTIASVEGEVFTAQVLAEVQKLPERSILRQLSQDLERKHRLVREQEEVETSQRRLSTYRFCHFIFQDYLHKRLGLVERRLLHGDIGAALEKVYVGQLDEMAVQLAHHFYQADDHGRAYHYSTLAAESAARAYDSREAITHYTHAIQMAEKVSPDIGSLACLLRGRGLAYERLGMFDHAHDDHTAIQQMAHAAGELQLEWLALLDLGKLWSSRDCDQARYYFDVAMELARRLDDPSCLADSLNWLGNWYVNDGNPDRAIAHHQEALTILEDLGDAQELASTLDLLAFSNVVGSDLNASVRNYERAIAVFRELDDRPRLANSLIGRADAVSTLAWLASVPPIPAPDAALDLEEALRIAAEIASAPTLAWAHYSSCMLHTVQGAFDRALEDIKIGLRIAEEIGHRHYVVCARCALGMLYTELFALDEAREQYEIALPLAQVLRSPTWRQALLGALASVHLVLGDLKSAEACLETAISPHTSMDTIGKRYCWVRQAELELAQGGPGLALDITERLISSAPGMAPGRVITYLWKLKGEALAANGKKEEALSMLLTALENARANKERYLLWRIHACLGRLYQSMGDRQAGEKEIEAAGVMINELAATILDEASKANFRQGASANCKDTALIYKHF